MSHSSPGFSFTWRSILFLGLVFSSTAASGNDSARKAIRIMGSAYAMANRYYSHHANTTALRNPGSEHQKSYFPGYAFGITSLLGRSRSGNITLGMSFSSSRGVFNSSTVKSEASSKYDYVRYSTVTTSTVEVAFINYEVGYRFRIFRKNIYFQPIFVLNDNLVLRIHQRGTYTTVHEFYDGQSTATTQTSGDFDIRRKEHRGTSASLRAVLWYDFKIGNQQYSLSAFRNFGIDFDIPWWGLGCAVVF